MGGGGDKIEHFCETHLFVVQQIHNVMYCTHCCAINCDFLCTLFSSLNPSVYRIDLYLLFIYLLFYLGIFIILCVGVIYIYTTK